MRPAAIWSMEMMPPAGQQVAAGRSVMKVQH